MAFMREKQHKNMEVIGIPAFEVNAILAQ